MIKSERKPEQKNAPSMQQAAFTMAAGILAERIRSLPKDDREDLYELVKILAASESDEEIESVAQSMVEIIEQAPVRVLDFEQPAEDSDLQNLKKWVDFVGRKVKEARNRAKFTQEDLAKTSGLPQSHISRIESGKLSPNQTTLERIARALNLGVGAFDPSCDE